MQSEYATGAFAVGPVLSPSLALACNLFYTVLYVAPFYLSPTLRSTPLHSRDSPQCIRARIRTVAVVCAVCTVVTACILRISGAASSFEDLVRLLGVWPTSLSDLIRVLALVSTLFACSLYERYVVDGEWRNISVDALLDALWRHLPSFRNYVVAPFTEELAFRALTVPLYLCSGMRLSRIVFVTPLIFGLAHVHHFVEFLRAHTHPGASGPSTAVFVKATIRTLFQFTYTSLFGFFATFVFLRTGSLWVAVAVHAFCNWMGVPRLWGRVGKIYEEPSPEDASVGWTVLYYVLVSAGIYSFSRGLWRWTESDYALASF